MQSSENLLIEDFHQNFLNFYAKTKDITNVRFNYMRELYNLGVDTFPDNQEVYTIQQNNKLNLQSQQNKLKKNWTDDDKKVLIWLVGKWTAFNRRDIKSISDDDWNSIASMMPRRDAFKCKQKWLQMLKLPLQQAPWTLPEDDLLRSIIYDYQNLNKGNKWSQIATTLNKISESNIHRNGKQCRERWNNHLNPFINRNPWQLNEDLDLLQLSIQNGKKWALISKKLKIPRSENSVKNRFNCLLRKERSQKAGKKDEEESESEESKISNFPSAEELNHDEIKLIHTIIKKIEWRIQQSENLRENEQKDIVKEEHLDIIKKIKVESNLPLKRDLRHSQSNSNNKDKINLQVKECQLTEVEMSTLQPCLINKEKNQIFFVSPEQLHIYLNRSEISQQSTFQENNLSNQNSIGSYYYDPKLLRSYVMMQSNEYPQIQSGVYQQRSIINQNMLGNFQSLNNYPYPLPMSSYPSQANLMGQLQR
ncbi:unnamed protein product [Paramecium primaurelia]|uniref:Uncharacterized protein n=1 Tax=Paramecium primaurelia TaxID=5886 RepID=A0A8S1N8J9_PARPR|nr:unnamed protein product [Paramecium primaurelia]